jgi:hypothetical protein
MKSPARVLLMVFLALLATGSLGANAAQDRPQEGYWSCTSGYENNPIYVTPVWDATEDAAEVRNAFVKMLSTKYSYTGRVSCSRADKPPTNLAAYQAGLVQQYAQWQKSGKTIVQTGWTNQPEAARPRGGQTPATAGQARPGGSPVKWGVCRLVALAPGAQPRVGPYRTYISGAFVRGTTSETDLARAFGEFLSTKYGLGNTTPQCASGESEAEAQAILKGWMDDSAKNGTAIESGWKYTPR